MKKSIVVGVAALALVSLSACGKKPSNNSGANYISSASQGNFNVTQTTVDNLESLISSGKVNANTLYQLTGTLVGATSWQENTKNQTTTVVVKGSSQNLPIVAPTSSVDEWTDNTQVNVTLRYVTSGSTRQLDVTTSSILSGGTTKAAKLAALTQTLLDNMNKVKDGINQQMNATAIENITIHGDYPNLDVTLSSGFSQMSTDNFRSSITNINNSFVGSASGLAPQIHYLLDGSGEIAVNQGPDKPNDVTFEGNLAQ